MDIVTAGNTISSAIVVPLIQLLIHEIDDVIHLDDNRKLLEEQLNRMKSLLLDISSQFQHQQREVPDSLNNCLLRMQRKVGEAGELIHRSQRPWLQQCIDCVLCKPKVFTQIREWNTTIRDLHDQLRTDFSVICSAQLIASAAPQHADVLLQDQPDTGLVGLQFEDAESQLVRWLTDSSLVDIHTIGVYGMGGVGKTTLLKKVHNTVQVSHIFDHVIWVTVAQFPIQQIQQDIASAINLDLANHSTDERKMKLSARLRTTRFFLILDDMWSGFNLKELGVEFGTGKGSKLVFSTRNRDLIEEMNAEESIEIRQLPTEEAWDLFCRVAFKDGHVPEVMEQIAREVAGECKGLPLAITVIASTMKSKRAINDWKFALRQMQKVDLSFPITHPRIDRELYQRLRWSYDTLPTTADLKNCFLYCALFEEDAVIEEEDLVQMWISEGLIKTSDGDYDYLLDTGRSYLKLLLDRCLLNEASHGPYIYVHDVIRDMGIYIGEKEENYLFRAGQRLQHFPDMEGLADCKRLSVRHNNITSLPTKEFTCPKLVSLLLGNTELRTIPEGFFLNFTSLKVLNLNGTALKSLPTSLWQLIHLEYLELSKTYIENIPEDIGNLVHLQFLWLCHCSALMSLPSEIGKLTNLKYLDIRDTPKLMPFPHDIKVLLKCKIVDRMSELPNVVWFH